MATTVSPSVHLKIKKYDIATLGDTRVVLICGKRNTGKSILAAEILYHKRHIPLGIVMSSTEEATGFFKKTCGIPDSFIYHEWNPDAIQKVIDKQRDLCKAGRPRSCFIVLDDMLVEKGLFTSRQMRDLMFNGRHYGIFLLITAQAVGELPVWFRGNVDICVVLREPTINVREKLYRNFFGIIPTLHLFCELLTQCTDNYEALVVDQTVQTNALDSCVFWYKAQIRSPFQMGCRAYHSFHSRRYNAVAAAASAAPKAKPTGPAPTARRPSVNVQKLV